MEREVLLVSRFSVPLRHPRLSPCLVNVTTRVIESKFEFGESLSLSADEREGVERPY